MHAQEYTTTLECPSCGENFEVECSLLIDPGVRYHADGSGTPPSEDFNAKIPDTCPNCGREFTDQATEILSDQAREAAPDLSWDGPEPEERDDEYPPPWDLDD
jgi:predicted RNA-binding Zn-ribbon protein involved in translation (DUF1610 family)